MPLYVVHSIVENTKHACKLNRQLIDLSKIIHNVFQLRKKIHMVCIITWQYYLITRLKRKFLGFTIPNNLHGVDMQLGLANDKSNVALAITLCLALCDD
jgi:hypothetical protein